jgi:CRISPR/Cas system-associated exonuclease Cas4 (RecB family)
MPILLNSEVKKSTIKKDVQIFKNGKNNILYPIFLECIQYTNDDFWKNLFEELSYGKCHKSIYISNGTIYSSNKKKSFSYIIPESKNKNSQEVFTDIRKLLMENTSICSAIDISTKKEELKENQIDDEITDDTSWGEIRKKNLREIFLIKYSVNMKKKYKLSWAVTRQLYSMIQVGFIYKTIVSKDVNFHNKQIENIEGIEYDKELKRFVNHFADNDPKEKEEEYEDNNSNYLYYYWDRYVSGMSRII